MRYSVIVQFTRHIDREYTYDDDGELTSGFDDEDFTKDEIRKNKPDFKFRGLAYTQFDDGRGCGYGDYDWSGVLTETAMKKLMQKLCLEVTDEKSMGTIGAPGCGYVQVPNIIMRGSEDDCIFVDAFVTPIPTEREAKKLTWETAKQNLAALAA